MVSFLIVIGEWQWEKFRAFDFLCRSERGRGWGLGGSEKESLSPRCHLPALGLTSAEVPTFPCRSKLTEFAASLFDIVILSPESDIDMLSFRSSITGPDSLLLGIRIISSWRHALTPTDSKYCASASWGRSESLGCYGVRTWSFAFLAEISLLKAWTQRKTQIDEWMGFSTLLNA